MLRFSFPGERDAAPGLVLERGRLAEVAGVAALAQAIRFLLATRPGERLGEPEFGCALDRLLFEPNDATTAGMAMRLVADALARFVPEAEIEHLDAGPDPDRPERLLIELAFRDRRSGDTDRLSVPLALDDAAR